MFNYRTSFTQNLIEKVLRRDEIGNCLVAMFEGSDAWLRRKKTFLRAESNPEDDSLLLNAKEIVRIIVC